MEFIDIRSRRVRRIEEERIEERARRRRLDKGEKKVAISSPRGNPSH